MALGIEIGSLIDRDDYPHLTLAQVHAALAYYHVNRDEIETDIAEEGAAALHWEEQFGDTLARTAEEMLGRLEFISGW
jgi:hypothetical protein